MSRRYEYDKQAKRMVRIDGDEPRPLTEAEQRAGAARTAEMIRARTPPGTRGTEKAYMEGRGVHTTGLEGLVDPGAFIDNARRAGVNTSGKYYERQLASYFGDPNGWVSGLDEVVDKCKAQNRSCEGARTVKAAEGPPVVVPRLDDELVAECMTEELMKDPGQAANMAELREKVIDKHGSKPAVQHNVVIK